MAIRGHQMTPDLIAIESTTGSRLEILRTDVIAYRQTHTRLQTLAWLRDQCEQAFGSDILPRQILTVDVDDATGRFVGLIIENSLRTS